MKHFPFPSIEQFRTVIKYVNDRVDHHHVAKKPKLLFSGTVKLHGTNASVVLRDGEVYAQSRSNVITPENDNAGFAAFVAANKAQFQALGQAYAKQDLVLYGEWCGKGIQKGVAISQVEKRFVLFAICLLKDDEKDTWAKPSQLVSFYGRHQELFSEQITCIYQFPIWQVEVDFANPAAIQNTLVELTIAVEQECPVGKKLGVIGVGEGIVWVCEDSKDLPFSTSDLIFKVKGEKHSDTKTKTLAPVDVEKIAKLTDLANMVCTDHRLEKGFDQLKLDHPGVDVLDMSMIPHFLKWVGQDILKEESDTIAENGFEPREVTKVVNGLARVWFKGQVDGSI